MLFSVAVALSARVAGDAIRAYREKEAVEQARMVAQALCRFWENQGRFPRDLNELVSEGYLPGSVRFEGNVTLGGHGGPCLNDPFEGWAEIALPRFEGLVTGPGITYNATRHAYRVYCLSQVRVGTDYFFRAWLGPDGTPAPPSCNGSALP